MGKAVATISPVGALPPHQSDRRHPASEIQVAASAGLSSAALASVVSAQNLEMTNSNSRSGRSPMTRQAFAYSLVAWIAVSVFWFVTMRTITRPPNWRLS